MDSLCPSAFATVPCIMKIQEAISRVRDVLRRQHKALATEKTYVFWLQRYTTALRHMPPTLTSEKKLESFLTDLARRYDVSASSQNQALNAILFFYREVLGQTLGNINSLRAKRPGPQRPSAPRAPGRARKTTRQIRCPVFPINLPTVARRQAHWGEGVTAEEMSDYTWLRPETEAEIKFAEWTTGAVLRHAEFVALREF